jgi:hypothetical protein
VIVLVFLGSSDQLKSGMHNLTTLLVYEVQVTGSQSLAAWIPFVFLYFLFHLCGTKGDK